MSDDGKNNMPAFEATLRELGPQQWNQVLEIMQTEKARRDDPIRHVGQMTDNEFEALKREKGWNK